MTTDRQETTDPLRPNVKTFKPSSFQLSQFEVVAEGGSVSDFTSSEWVCVEKSQREADAMFEIFDGTVVGPVGAPSDEEASMVVADSGNAEREARDPWDETAEVDAATQEKLQELQQALVQAQEEREALEAEHSRYVEELRVQVAEEVRQESEKQSEERLKAIEERYAALIEDMNTQIQEGVEGVERRAVEFAVHIAKKLIGTIVEVNPEYILGVIKEATKLTGGATIKAIRVSPQDLEFLKMLSPDKQFKEFDGSWSFQADETIHAGCVVETSSGEVEFDLDKAWERIKESVIKVR